MKTGILLLNFGGPERIEDVKPFLRRLFTDPDILVGLDPVSRWILAWLISTMKGPSSERMYEKIGGGSPQLKWSRVQAEGMLALLNSERARENELIAEVGLRASNPDIREALEKLRSAGAEELVLIPFFPQYSTTTTRSCLKEVERQLRRFAKKGWSPSLKLRLRWPDHEGYIALLRSTVDEAVTEARRQARERGLKGKAGEPYVLFSAHSIPMKIVKRGDPYPGDVDRTIQAVTRGLSEDWSLAFQSRNGPIPWLQPYTEDVLAALPAQGRKCIVVVPVSFVSDHIETLFELDLQYAEEARHAGVEVYVRSRSFNDEPRFFDVLADLVRTAGPTDLETLRRGGLAPLALPAGGRLE